jgi:predicted nucleic acid-binding protein
MILVDTGPLVALFDRRDADHQPCRRLLADLTEPLCTTVPVLTEAFHLLAPAGRAMLLWERHVCRDV